MRGKKARAFRAYKKIKTLKPSRSLFDLTHDVLFTGDMGKLYPICWAEMSPGDTFHIWNEIVSRMQPLLAPILHEINLTTHFFFVPYRILWSEWTDFISGGVEGEYGGNNFGIEEPGEVSPELPRWNPTVTSVGSLWDYLGLPTGVVPTGALPVDFIRRCYNRIWNEYYRDETLQDPVDETNELILHRNWSKDYFTSALLSQQRGVSPAMPLSGTVFTTQNNYNFINSGATIANPAIDSSGAPALIKIYFECGASAFADVSEDGFLHSNFDTTFTLHFSGSASGVHYDELTITSSSGGVSFTAVPKLAGTSRRLAITISYTGGVLSFDTLKSCDISGTFGNTSVDLSNAGTFDIKDLRIAFQIQKWLELANRGGVRYTEFLRSFFGVSPRDDRLQRPEYIGGTKSAIVVSEVLQTSSTSGEPTPQGYMAGHGVSAARTFVGSYTAVEFGMVMGLLSVMPKAKYQQGINRQLLRRTKYDFLFPQFTHLSEQAIEEAEIYAQDTEAKNRKVFGYNEIYDELRSIPSRICGKMRSTFDYWHLGRKFDSAPSLNSDFITCNPSKRIFAVTDEDGFIFNVSNIIRAVRPLPKYGTPGGV